MNKTPRDARRPASLMSPVRAADTGDVQAGSILLAVLFVCIGCAMLVLVLNALVVAGLRVASTEKAGRAGQAVADQVLETLRSAALGRWEARVVSADATSAVLCLPSLAQDDTTPSYLVASATIPAALHAGKLVESRDISGTLERAWDGLDLPRQAVVASSILMAADRTVAGVLAEPSGAVTLVPVATQFVPVEGVGAVTRTPLVAPWWLDEGTLAWLAEGPGLAPNTEIREGRAGTTVVPRVSGSSCENPVLLVLARAGSIDARGLGEIWGVLAAPENVLLDGTTLHGAVFCTRDVMLGETGCVVFDERVRCWASDHSLYRVRLVPGTRLESWADGG